MAVHLALAALLVASAPVARAATGLPIDASRTVLSRGGVTLAESAAPPNLSVLYSDATDIWQARTWRELAADAVSVRRTAAGRTIVMPSFGGLPVRAVMDVALDSAAGTVTFAIEVRNRAPGVVVGVVGPALCGIADRPGGRLLTPNRPGHQHRDPWTALSERVVSLEYPVPASMQYTVYAGEGGGVSYQVRDREMLYKQLLFGGPRRELSAIQYPFIPPGGRWESPPVVWQAVGDWHAAADTYGAWFRSWAEAPRVSPYIRKLPVVPGTVILARRVEDEFLKDVRKEQEVKTYAAALEQAKQFHAWPADGVHIVGWFGQGHDSAYPDHLPAESMGGEVGLRAYIDGLHSMGMLAFLYLNARLLDVTSQSYLAHPEWRALLASGGPREERIGAGVFHVACPAAPGYRRHLTDEVLRVARDYGGDGAQLDQIGAAWSVMCFDESHGHRTPASAWAEGHVRFLRQLRAELGAVNPSFACWIEGAWEGAGQFVDLSQGGFWQDVPGDEPFPAMYRYTMPDHPMFGDSRMGDVPYWCPTDIARARRINAAAAPVFQHGRFLDDQGLTVSPEAEAHWFLAGSRAVVTVTSPPGQERLYTVRIGLDRLGRADRPAQATALAAGTAVDTRLRRGARELQVRVPPGQVEAVLLDW